MWSNSRALCSAYLFSDCQKPTALMVSQSHKTKMSILWKKHKKQHIMTKYAHAGTFHNMPIPSY